MNKLKYKLIIFTTVVMTLFMVFIVAKAFLTSPPAAAITMGMHAEDGYEEPLESAMDLWNGYVGCRFLVKGDDVTVKSDNAAPCGDTWRPEGEEGHAGTAYKCAGKDDVFEIMISSPGTTHQQAYIIAHEIGHVLGREHQYGSNVMFPSYVEGWKLRISDNDVAAMKARFCK